MKKGTILRNDAPHAVNMPEGSKVAARKVKKEPISAPMQDEVPPAPNTSGVKSPKPKAAKDTSPPAKVASQPQAKTRAKPKTPDKVVTATKTASKKTKSSAAVPVPAPLPVPIDEAAIWEKDNPVKTRMSQLKARNALLEEQLQRLQSPFQARGRKP